MPETQIQVVDSLNLMIPVIVGFGIFVGTIALSELAIGATFTYGGNACAETETVAATCGVPPLGIVAAIAAGVVGAGLIQRRFTKNNGGGD